MNTRLLRKVIKSIKEEPRRLKMQSWGQKVRPSNPKNPPCGTKACIAGHVAFCSGQLAFNKSGLAEIKDNPGIGIMEWAEDKLDLSRTQTGKLFFFQCWNGGVGWPRKFSTAYNKSKNAKQRAAVTIKRIEHFIRTGGEE